MRAHTPSIYSLLPPNIGTEHRARPSPYEQDNISGYPLDPTGGPTVHEIKCSVGFVGVHTKDAPVARRQRDTCGKYIGYIVSSRLHLKVLTELDPTNSKPRFGGE